jgi:hypothetical protein
VVLVLHFWSEFGRLQIEWLYIDVYITVTTVLAVSVLIENIPVYSLLAEYSNQQVQLERMYGNVLAILSA